MLLDAIRARLDHFPQSERRVALAVLQNPQAAVAGNISALAQRADVSEPTVVRFCRRMGLDGWHAFKLRLAQHMALSPPEEAGAPLVNDAAGQLIEKICNRSIHALLALRNSLSAGAIDKAVRTLAGATRLFLYAEGGAAGSLAADAQLRFFRAGTPVTVCADLLPHGMAAALSGKGDAVLAISLSGAEPGLLRSCRLAKRGGSALIVLAPGGSPLARMAQVSIPIDASMETDPGLPLSGLLMYLAVIDVLAVALALKRDAKSRKRLAQAHAALPLPDEMAPDLPS